MDEMEDSTGSRHRRAWDLIPWFVNGSATPAERQVVDAHVAACEDCRTELAFQQQVHAGMGGGAMHAPGSVATEPALQRFWAEAGARQAQRDAPLRPPARRGNRPAAAARWPRVLAAAVVVQAIGLAVLGGMLSERPRPADYQTLSRAAPGLPVATLRIVPAPVLRVGELQAVLARSGVQLVETSADGGILGGVLRPDAGVGLDEALQRLRAEPGVLLAEPIVAAP